MNFIGMFMGVLVKFGTNILLSFASEKMLEYVFFSVAGKLVAKTETKVDDEWLAQLKLAYEERKNK